jgi:hypothetical protein
MPFPLCPGKTRPSLRVLAFCVVALALAGCMSLTLQPTTFTGADRSAAAKPAQLPHSVSALLTNDATVTLPGGSQWALAGSIPQGQVYRKVGGTLMIEGKRVREAYPVVSGGKLVGFYFPGEASFTPLSYTPTLNLEQMQ